MVAVGLLDHGRRHPEETGGLPDRHAGLHEPRSGCVAQRMSRDLAGQPGK